MATNAPVAYIYLLKKEEERKEEKNSCEATSYAVGFGVLLKKSLQHVRMSFCLGKVEKLVSRLRLCRSSLQDLSGGVPRFSIGPVARNHRPHFFDPNEVNMFAMRIG